MPSVKKHPVYLSQNIMIDCPPHIDQIQRIYKGFLFFISNLDAGDIFTNSFFICKILPPSLQECKNQISGENRIKLIFLLWLHLVWLLSPATQKKVNVINRSIEVNWKITASIFSGPEHRTQKKKTRWKTFLSKEQMFSHERERDCVVTVVMFYLWATCCWHKLG